MQGCRYTCIAVFRRVGMKVLKYEVGLGGRLEGVGKLVLRWVEKFRKSAPGVMFLKFAPVTLIFAPSVPDIRTECS